MPAWVDLNPEGKFIADLFSDNEKKHTPHFLAFGYNSGELFNTKSNDGVINLSSQLSRPAQLHASQILGYNENHLSILDNDDLFEDLSEFWLRAEGAHWFTFRHIIELWSICVGHLSFWLSFPAD